jgi:hypothetical protein
VSPTSSEQEFVEEALRLNARYLDEVVERFDFCPYARGARAAGQVARTVILDAHPTAATVKAVNAIPVHAARAETVIALLIFPRLALDPDAFDRFVNEVRSHEARPAFALAAFHPQAAYGVDTPAKLVMLLRRAPDPTIQLVRFSALDAVKGSHADANKKFLFQWNASAFAELEKRGVERSPSEKIAQANFETVAREGEARIRAVLDDIRADRDRSYQRFG